jgi:hypothetical protein
MFFLYICVYTRRNGYSVLYRAVSVSAVNRRITYNVKHITEYIFKKSPQSVAGAFAEPEKYSYA